MLACFHVFEPKLLFWDKTEDMLEVAGYNIAKIK
jgi:hypothetical protein